MQVSKNIKYSADVLKQEISKLKNDLGESAKADIQAAETEKQRLSMVKTTIQYLKKAGRICSVAENIGENSDGSKKQKWRYIDANGETVLNLSEDYTWAGPFFPVS